MIVQLSIIFFRLRKKTADKIQKKNMLLYLSNKRTKNWSIYGVSVSKRNTYFSATTENLKICKNMSSLFLRGTQHLKS